MRYRIVLIQIALASLLLTAFPVEGWAQIQSIADSSCSSGQKSGSDIGGWFGRTIGKAVTDIIPPKFRTYTQSLGIADTAQGAGRLLGSRIGCLTAADQKKADDAVKVTTDSGRPQTWTGSEPGVSGQTRVVSNAKNCRVVQETVTRSDGTQQSDQVKYCKGPGGWEEASK